MNYKMKNEDDIPPTSEHTPNSDDNKAFFVPAEDLQVINRALEDWETVKRKWDMWMNGKYFDDKDRK